MMTQSALDEQRWKRDGIFSLSSVRYRRTKTEVDQIVGKS